jgi:CheY-like chemotaxis protein
MALLTVVVVDDEEDHASLLAAGFERLGYRARVYTGPSASYEALQAARLGQIDTAAAFVIDLNLDPRGLMDGDSLYRGLRHLGIRAPACLLTGASIDDVALHRRSRGFAAVVTKPPRMDAFRPFLTSLRAAPAQIGPMGDGEDSAIVSLSSLH